MVLTNRVEGGEVLLAQTNMYVLLEIYTSIYASSA